MVQVLPFAELLQQLWFRFLLTVFLGFLTGLEFREYLLLRSRERPEVAAISLGTARTFTFIAVLGFVFYELDPDLRLFLAGLAALVLWMALFYHHKLQAGQTGLLQVLMALLVYSYGPVIDLLPPWFLVLLFVTLVLTLSARPFASAVTQRLDPGEITTLAKFLLLAGVILPLLPDQRISPWVPATPYRMWLAVVVISAISYSGYILKKYFFKRQGYLLTGLLGGLYSSTATTVVLARRLGAGPPDSSIEAGIVAATGVMYLRLLTLVALMNSALLVEAGPPLLVLGLLAIGGAWLLGRKHPVAGEVETEMGRGNPLELGIAVLFALLFVVTLVVTDQVIIHYGQAGLDLLSLAVGLTDTDPFVLSVLSGHYAAVKSWQLGGAIVIAAGSNNLFKGVLSLALGGRRQGGRAAVVLLVLGLVTVACGLVMSRLPVWLTG